VPLLRHRCYKLKAGEHFEAPARMKELEPRSNSLIIAPQWLGDAVMTEPLLRRLQARGEKKLVVGALPCGGADLPCHAAGQRGDRVPFSRAAIELPRAPRAGAPDGGSRFDTRLRAASQFRSRARYCPSWPASRSASATSAKRASVSDAPAQESEEPAADGGLLLARSAASKTWGRTGRNLSVDAAAADLSLREAGLQRGAYHVVCARRRVRSGQALAGCALRRAGTRVCKRRSWLARVRARRRSCARTSAARPPRLLPEPRPRKTSLPAGALHSSSAAKKLWSSNDCGA